jgi:hypothetical protein
MALERRRPLPAGRYWADIFAPRNAFDAWVQMANSRGAIHGEVSEHFEATDGAPEHDFVIFTTNTDLVWPDADMGFSPNVAPPNIKSSADTVQRPPPEPGAIDQISEAAAEWNRKVNTAMTAVLVLLVAGAAVAIFRRTAPSKSAPRKSTR